MDVTDLPKVFQCFLATMNHALVITLHEDNVSQFTLSVSILVSLQRLVYLRLVSSPANWCYILQGTKELSLQSLMQHYIKGEVPHESQ